MACAKDAIGISKLKSFGNTYNVGTKHKKYEEVEEVYIFRYMYVLLLDFKMKPKKEVMPVHQDVKRDKVAYHTMPHANRPTNHPAVQL